MWSTVMAVLTVGAAFFAFKEGDITLGVVFINTGLLAMTYAAVATCAQVVIVVPESEEQTPDA